MIAQFHITDHSVPQRPITFKVTEEWVQVLVDGQTIHVTIQDFALIAGHVIDVQLRNEAANAET